MSDLAMLFPFSKWNGAGNDFLLFHLQSLPEILPESWIKWIATICHRQSGIGADGAVFCAVRDENSYWMRIFNSDGSCPPMCGNALRCTALFFAHQRKDSEQPFQIHLQSIHEVFVQKDGQPCVEISIPPPATPVSLKVENRTFEGQLLDTGVPHFVVRAQDIYPQKIELDQIPLKLWGPILREKSNWSELNCPNGANITFVEVVRANHLRIRTFERGVEAETWACGTGAAAAAWLHGNLRSDSSVCTVVFASGENAIIHLTNSEAKLRLWQTGPARCVFTGQIELLEELDDELIKPA